MQETLITLHDNVDHVYLTIVDLLNAGLTPAEIGVVVADISGDYSGMVSGDIKGEVSAGFGAVLQVMTNTDRASLTVKTLPGIGTAVIAGTLHTADSHPSDVLSTFCVSPAEQDIYLEAVRRGYVLMTVTTRQDTASIIEDLLKHHHPVDINLVSQNWQHGGWHAFDAAAATYTVDDTEHERRRYQLFAAERTADKGATVKRYVITG